MTKAQKFLPIATLAIAVLILNKPMVGQSQPALPAPSPLPARSGSSAPAANNDQVQPDANTDLPASSENDLQAEVQTALSKVPELSNDSVKVTTSNEGLELSGTVATGRERQAALRIVQSFARGRKVVDHVVVTGRNSPPAESGAPDKRVAHQANVRP